jgi:hypothetical protein
MYEIYKKAVIKLDECSKERSLFLAHDKNWTKTASIRSTLVRPQIETTGEYEGCFQESIGV